MEKQGQDLSSYLKQQKTENIRDNDLQGTDIRQQKTEITKRWETDEPYDFHERVSRA